MTLNVVVNHPVKDLIDDNLKKFNTAHEEGKLQRVLLYYSTTEGEEYAFRKDLNTLEAMGACHMLQESLLKEYIEE